MCADKFNCFIVTPDRRVRHFDKISKLVDFDFNLSVKTERPDRANSDCLEHRTTIRYDDSSVQVQATGHIAFISQEV